MGSAGVSCGAGGPRSLRSSTPRAGFCLRTLHFACPQLTGWWRLPHRIAACLLQSLTLHRASWRLFCFGTSTSTRRDATQGEGSKFCPHARSSESRKRGQPASFPPPREAAACLSYCSLPQGAQAGVGTPLSTQLRGRTDLRCQRADRTKGFVLIRTLRLCADLFGEQQH